MKKSIAFLFVLFISLSSCKKDDPTKDNPNDNTVNPPTPSTLVVSNNSFLTELYYCVFTYYDVDGVLHQSEDNMDRTVTNVDFSRPFRVEAQAGITMYDPVTGPILNPQYVDWQLKKDGVVVDAHGATTYVYEN